MNAFQVAMSDKRKTINEVFLSAFNSNGLTKSSQLYMSVAPNFIDTTTKLPSVSQDVYSKIFAFTPVFAAPLPTIHEGVKMGGLVLPKFNQNSFFQAPSCNAVDGVANDTSIGEKKLIPCQYEYNDTLCVTDFSDLFNQLGVWRATPGANQLELLPVIWDRYWALVRSQRILLIESAMWNGDTSVILTPTNYHIKACDGILKKALADPDVVNISFGPIINAGNIILALETLYQGIKPETIQMQLMGDVEQSPYIVMNFAYSQILQTVYNTTSGFFGGTENLIKNGLIPTPQGRYSKFSYNGVPIYFSPVFPANEMIALTQQNFHFGTDLLDDMDSMIVSDNRIGNAGKKSFTFNGVITAGFEYIYGDYVTYLHI